MDSSPVGGDCVVSLGYKKQFTPLNVSLYIG